MMNKLPKFPNSRILSVSDRFLIADITKQYPPYSDFNFTSMFCWDRNDDCEISTLNNNLVVKFRDYITNEPFYSFMGKDQVDSTIAILLEHSRSENLDGILKLIPDIVVENTKNRKKFKITEDRDNHDYIYSVEQSVQMPGSQYMDRRKFINRFQKKYGDTISLHRIDLSDEKVQKDILGVFRTWEQTRGKKPEETLEEHEALAKLLKHAQMLSLVSIGIFDKDRLVAFSINEILDNKYAINHFEKADVNYDRIFYYTRNENVKVLHSEGVIYINGEQDLGLEGLRMAKLSFRPIKFLKKYKVTQAN